MSTVRGEKLPYTAIRKAVTIQLTVVKWVEILTKK